LRENLFRSRRPLEIDSPEGRQSQAEGIRLTLAWLMRGVLPSSVADVGAAIMASVGVEYFLVVTGMWHADEVAFAHHRRRVDGYDDQIV
jgi:hypothetical protein